MRTADSFLAAAVAPPAVVVANLAPLLLATFASMLGGFVYYAAIAPVSWRRHLSRDKSVTSLDGFIVRYGTWYCLAWSAACRFLQALVLLVLVGASSGLSASEAGLAYGQAVGVVSVLVAGSYVEKGLWEQRPTQLLSLNVVGEALALATQGIVLGWSATRASSTPSPTY